MKLIFEPLILPIYANSILLLLVFLCFVFRFYQHSSFNVYDPASQYFYAVKATINQSICPAITSKENLVGRNHYPLSFYWHCGRLARLLLALSGSKENFSAKTNILSSSPLFTLTIHIIKVLNILVLPILNLFIFFLFFYTGQPISLFLLTGNMVFIVLLNTLYQGSSYPINTRNSGYFVVGLFMFSLICRSFGVNSETIVGALNNSPFLISVSNYDYAFAPLMALILCFSSYFILQTSQQGAYVYVSLLIASVIFFWDFGLIALTSLVFTFLVSLQLKFTDVFQHVRAHFHHRIHMLAWADKAYSNGRYRLEAIPIKKLISEIFSYQYLRSGFLELSSKRNWSVAFLTYRYYVYALLLLITIRLSGYQMEFVSLSLILSAALVPSLLSLTRTFQGYGPPSLPLVSLLPYVSLIYCWSFSSLNYEFIPFSCRIIAIVSFLDGILILLVHTIFLTNSIFTAFRSTSFSFLGVLSKNSIFGSDNNFNDLMKCFDWLINISSNKPFSIVSIGIHYQSLIEAAVLYKNSCFSTSASDSYSLQSPWNCIDNMHYGWRMDQIKFDLKPQLLCQLRPKLVLYNPMRPSWFNSFLDYINLDSEDHIIFSKRYMRIVNMDRVSILLRKKYSDDSFDIWNYLISLKIKSI